MTTLPALPLLLAADVEAWSMQLGTAPVFLPAFISLCALYPVLAPRFAPPRQAAWILTTAASALMTAAALPFVADYLRAAGAVAQVQLRPVFACAVTRFFQAYLAADLIVGFLAYRSQVGLLTGWVHHAVYLGITEIAIRFEWAHIFCLCAVMELPTFLLGLGTLFPRTRSNTLFALTFLATRIVLHLVLLFSYALPAGRPVYASSSPSTAAYVSTPVQSYASSYGGVSGGLGSAGVGGGAVGAGIGATSGSLVPAALLLLVFPLHAMWFIGCVKGFVRRYRARSAAAVSASPATSKERHILAPDIYPDARSLMRHSSSPPSSVPTAWTSRISLRLATASPWTARLAASPLSPWSTSPWTDGSPWTTHVSTRLRRLRALVEPRPGGVRMGLRALVRTTPSSLSASLAATSLSTHARDVSARISAVRPIRPRAMARRMSETLIAGGGRVIKEGERVIAALPSREVVLDYVGLGR